MTDILTPYKTTVGRPCVKKKRHGGGSQARKPAQGQAGAYGTWFWGPKLPITGCCGDTNAQKTKTSVFCSKRLEEDIVPIS